MTNNQLQDLEILRQQAEAIKEDIKQKRRECRDTTMQQVITGFSYNYRYFTPSTTRSIIHNAVNRVTLRTPDHEPIDTVGRNC